MEDEQTAKRVICSEPLQRQNPKTPGTQLGLGHPWQSQKSGQDLCELLHWMMQRHCPCMRTNPPAGSILISLDVASRSHVHWPVSGEQSCPYLGLQDWEETLERMEVDIRVKERNKRQPWPQIPPQNKAESQPASFTASTWEAEPRDPLYMRGLGQTGQSPSTWWGRHKFGVSVPWLMHLLTVPSGKVSRRRKTNIVY